MTDRLIERTPSAYSFPLLIKNLMEPPLIYYPDREIIYRDQFKYTYRDFARRVHQLANMLTELGVKPGDVVAVMDWDSHRYLECFFAIPMIGAVMHTINVRLSPEQLIYTINHAEDSVILANADFMPILEAVKDQFETDPKIVLITDKSDKPDTSLALSGEYDAMVNGAKDSFDFPEFDENTMATLFYTTGTTGLPKGVYFSHRQLVLHTYGLLSSMTTTPNFRVDSSDVYMPLTPMFHVHAWGLPYMFTMLGNKQVYPGRYEPEMILKLVVGQQVSFSHCVPTIIHMLVSSPVINDLDLSRWKVVIGGSALPKGLCREALKHDINLTSAYGMSETCPLLTAAMLKPEMADWSKEDQVPIRCRTGLPVPNVLLKIIDANGNPLPHDGSATGEVVVRAPWLTQGYLKDPEKSEQLWENGWMHTGDVGFIDKEGYLQITDRIKDVIKTGGEWLSSLELEDIISQHDGVSEAAVVGVPDDKWGERPMAMVVLRDSHKGSVTEDDLKQFFSSFVDKGAIPKYGVPNRIDIVDEIPKTSVGKINKKEIRKQYAG
ncbi:MAG: fatty acid--CoA ligase [Thermodesulfobacteriota bacterium]|nr:fatty acid--CoA ligase [Thermodesulfobacteriota bacterium]